MEDRKYIDGVKWKKSPILLFPLADFSNADDVIRPIDTFLFSTTVEESIGDYTLLCLYDTRVSKFEDFESKVLLVKDNLVNCYRVEGDKILYCFDLIRFSLDVSYFLEGKYSKLSDKAKIKISNYWKVYNHSLGYNKPISMTLHPENFWEKVEEEMRLEKGEMRGYELASKYDLEEETFKGKITEEIGNCNNIDIQIYTK